MEETISKKLDRLSKESIRELENIGLGKMIPININFTINYKAKKRLGQCCNKRDINISSWLLEVGLDHDIKNTIIHEILHTFKDTIGHKAKWQYYAGYVNSRTDYNIARTTNVNKIYERANKVRPTQTRHYKWKIVCKKCGETFYRQRINNRTLEGLKSGKAKHTSCGGNEFEILNID